MDYDPTQFLGSAPHYLRGRPPYSADLDDVLRDDVGLDGTGHLVDVGSGPGTLGVMLAPLFARVTLVEPDPAMLAEAERHAAESGVAVEAVRATAEDLPALGLGPLRAVSFGQSFHRTDRQRVAETVFDALVRRYLGRQRRSGARLVADYSAERHEEVLARTRFGAPRTLRAPGRPDLVRGVDDVVSGVLSMSYAAPHLFGDRLDDFVADLRLMLDERGGTFWEWPGDTEVLVAARPS